MKNGPSPMNKNVQANKFPVFELTEKSGDGTHYFTANAAGLLAMRNLLDRMIDVVQDATRDGSINPQTMLRMQTSRHATAPLKSDPWNSPACCLAVALTNPSDLMAQLEDLDQGIMQA